MPKPSSTSARRGRLVRLTTAGFVLLGLSGYGAFQYASQQALRTGCTVASEGGLLELEPQQAANASTIAAVASSRGLPERALTIALATAMQESALRNLGHGDRDSVGLFQQRPSQGWGTVVQIMDPVYSSNEFFDGLVKIAGYSQLPLTVAAQKVQKSGFPQAYAKHETDAALLASALTGRLPGALSCTLAAADTANASAGDADEVRARLEREFGEHVVPRKETGTGGRTVAVTTSPDTVDEQGGVGRRGWELAQWAVAHARELRVERVAYGDRLWSAADSVEGWQTTKPGDGTGSSRTGAADTGEPSVGTTATHEDVRITVSR